MSSHHQDGDQGGIFLKRFDGKEIHTSDVVKIIKEVSHKPNGSVCSTELENGSIVVNGNVNLTMEIVMVLFRDNTF